MLAMRKLFVIAIGAAMLTGINIAQAQNYTNDQAKKPTIAEIQQQLNNQSATIKKLQQQLQTLKNQNSENDIINPLDKTTPRFGFLQLNTDQVDFRLYGQVNQAMMYAKDGNENNMFFVSNNASTPRIGTVGTMKINQDFNIGARIELGLKANASDVVSQTSHTPDNVIDLRKVEFIAQSQKFGSLWLGRGDTAMNGTSEVDLSGTDLAAYSSVADLGGGILFYDNNANALSSTTVGNVFNNLNTHVRENRIQYKTPTLYGFNLSASAMAGKHHDVALWYNDEWKYFKLAGAFGCISPQDISSGTNLAHGHVLNGSLSMLLNSGFNATFASGKVYNTIAGRDSPYFWYSKLGYQKKWFEFGDSSMSVDYGRYNNFAQSNDRGKTTGIGLVQNVDRWGSAFYGSYRLFKLNRQSGDLNNVNVYSLGVLFKF